MATSLKLFDVRYYKVDGVSRVRQVNARNEEEAEARIRHAVPGSYYHFAREPRGQ